jgi:hypothetical protein
VLLSRAEQLHRRLRRRRAGFARHDGRVEVRRRASTCDGERPRRAGPIRAFVLADATRRGGRTASIANFSPVPRFQHLIAHPFNGPTNSF